MYTYCYIQLGKDTFLCIGSMLKVISPLAHDWPYPLSSFAQGAMFSRGKKNKKNVLSLLPSLNT